MSEPSNEHDRRLVARGVALYGTIGLEMVLATLVGYWIGAKVDAWLGSEPWATSFFLIVGVAAGIKRLVSVVRRALREDGDDDVQAGPGI
jgi:F0F1-type ATP synthase assembly protein I